MKARCMAAAPAIASPAHQVVAPTGNRPAAGSRAGTGSRAWFTAGSRGGGVGRAAAARRRGRRTRRRPTPGRGRLPASQGGPASLKQRREGRRVRRSGRGSLSSGQHGHRPGFAAAGRGRKSRLQCRFQRQEAAPQQQQVGELLGARLDQRVAPEQVGLEQEGGRRWPRRVRQPGRQARSAPPGRRSGAARRARAARNCSRRGVDRRQGGGPGSGRRVAGCPRR